MNSKVFVNRILNMKKIKLIGLDMDHTLIRYNTKNFESLVYKLVIQQLIEKKHYPEAIQKFQFDFQDAIRGLIVDSKNGNILKLSRYGAIRHSFHGTKQINYIEQKKIYRSIYVDLNDSNYFAIDTSFSIAFCALFSQLIDLKDERPADLPSYATIALDVLNTVDKIHSDGSIKSVISQNLDEYVLKEPEVVEGLKRYIRYGKKIFILTNSEFFYTKLLLDYAINPFLKEGETWHDLFEYVITLANKPRFFYDKLRFLSINPDNGTMTNLQGRISPGVYQGGCATKFTEDLDINGDEILYIGDHIYGDIVRLKKDCNWRTALVVEELGQEINSQKNALPVERKIVSSMDVKKVLEEKYLERHTQDIEEQSHVHEAELQELQKQIASIDAEISKLLQEEQGFYNRRWGRVFRAGAEESYFAYQVDRFACIYMEKLADLLEQSPLTYFRANRRLLAHDVEI
ncbi:HAD superfamily (subfamily IG) hydrolase, 5'-nucleotidase [Legionella massiliensis]|uniref:HAD superfamily (Subfamily IG) hydrolase, 5'-nucleotidase n=1 Tax=Legionella massiliensis TaxID=1034943 RepID=A0A078L0J5_9GAMM|nr:HAD-IG family 5'-nucleotidase [Legionella massiliensis]CDZ78681.1 HAD superfamily (subfamily IG) hydrolase, 5'-nucleotidase [Legionella massiliensis]CEE14419.1 5' nucleotidase family protein [Legionella massiliensis]